MFVILATVTYRKKDCQPTMHNAPPQNFTNIKKIYKHDEDRHSKVPLVTLFWTGH